VGKVSFTNKKTRQFIGNLPLLIDEIFCGEEDVQRRDCWKEMITEYSMAIEILHKHSDYTDDDISRFQYLIDNFFEKYMKETGCEGITNYLHMLGSGHILYGNPSKSV
jgi:hypothetical protein